MSNLPRRRNPRKNGHGAPPNGSNGSSNGHSDPPAPPSADGPPPPLCPADELEALLHDPDEGAFLYGLEKRVYYPTLIEQITEAGERIVTVLGQYDSPDLFLRYESLEFDVAEVREHAAFSFGWQKGSADGRSEVLRSQAPGLSEQVKQVANRARALVVTEGLSPVDAAALLLETAWSILLTPPAPAFER
ncbi:MAG: hypothetical protein MUF34_14700 [Polyangiaceae bacterium]|jgi:hypothetical protein|nr:hypothetical protein [Polyangiaceae bacterium]